MTHITLSPGPRHGSVAAPASKSHAHRLLICGALGKTPVTIDCTDIMAGGTLKLANVRPIVKEVFEITGFDDRFTFV